MATHLILSASSISTYLKCHHAFLLSNVYRAPRRESLRMLIGTAAHAGIAAMLTGHPPLPALRDAWDEGIGRVDPDEVAADPDAFRDAEAVPEVYRREVMPAFTPDLVEKHFAVIPAGLGVTVTGVIDAADTRTDDMRDHKVTAGKTVNGVKPSFSPESYDLQGALYRLGYYGLTGRWPQRWRLDVLTRTGKHRFYERTPSVADALDLVAIVRDGVAAGDYEPTGAYNGSCSYCEYRQRCGYSNADS